MADSTKIEWADMTWSPWEGCTNVSPGCTNCYAERMNRWLHKGENWGPGAPRREYSEEHWQKPMRWNAKAAADGVRRKVFPSVCDPFDNEVDEGRRMRFFRLILDTPNLTWLLLTKRISNVLKMVDAGMWEHLTNVWLGATVVNQEEADRDVPKLLAVPARVRFLSIEPMLGPIDLTRIRLPLAGESFETSNVLAQRSGLDRGRERASLHWVICGGESGPGARPMHPDWARSLRDQCAAAGVPFLFKQWGEWTPGENVRRTTGRVDGATLVDGRWMPSTENLADADGHRDDEPDLYRIGKAAAGRLLDGVEHNGFPEARSGREG